MIYSEVESRAFKEEVVKCNLFFLNFNTFRAQLMKELLILQRSQKERTDFLLGQPKTESVYNIIIKPLKIKQND